MHQQLDELFVRYGCHSESQFSVQMPGEQGMDAMKKVMANFRACPPQELGGLKLARVRDYSSGTVTVARRKAGAVGWTQGGSSDSRPGSGGKLRGGTSFRHGAESEVLHVRLRPAGGIR